jgi:hypothetical protein
MSEINLDYGTINDTAAVLNNAENNISPQIKSLYLQVQGLLDNGGGLYLQNTSPAIASQYENFQSGALNCMSAILSFHDLFSGLVTTMQSFDQSTTNQINNPTS